jgi:hypothetical protein
MPKKKAKLKSIWFYCFKTKKYQKINKNKVEIVLDEKDFYDMVNSTESEQQRTDWLIKNNKTNVPNIPKHKTTTTRKRSKGTK